VSFPVLKAAVLVDVSDMYLRVQEVHGNAALNYLGCTEWLESLGSTVTFKVAYSRQNPTKVGPFLQLLRNNAWECHFGNQSWYMRMGLRAAEILPKVDILAIGSVTPESLDLCRYIREQGKLVWVFSAIIPPEFREVARCFEIPKELIRFRENDTRRKAKPVELPANIVGNGPQPAA